jgi:hypothetical protein
MAGGFPVHSCLFDSGCIAARCATLFPPIMETDQDELDDILRVRISRQERARLAALAAKDDRKVSQYVRHILRQALQTTEAA